MGKFKSKKRLLVGITGGIGAGKSALATVYRELGYPVFSADEIAREVVAPGSPALEEIRAVFGEAAVKTDGSLDRAFLREKISADPALRLKLEAITHPRIQERSSALSKKAFSDGADIVFYEAPLLFEARGERAMDKVICVHAGDELRLARTMKRDSSTRDAAEKLLKAQMPQEEKMKRSDFLVANEAGLAELKAAALTTLAQLKRNT
ncbi:MAG: dephospho-CoA kinase [Bdellovibrionota bacterium]